MIKRFDLYINTAELGLMQIADVALLEKQGLISTVGFRCTAVSVRYALPNRDKNRTLQTVSPCMIYNRQIKQHKTLTNRTLPIWT